VKLLRVLQDEMIRRVGDSRDLKVDVRIIAATHRDLAAEVKAGRFREDLFYRLNVLPIVVPPLRTRREDIALLIDHFVARNNARLGTQIRGVDTEARRLLVEYSWPGNVRELENTIERAMVLSEGDLLVAADLPDRIREVATRCRSSSRAASYPSRRRPGSLRRRSSAVPCRRPRAIAPAPPRCWS
jgi:two-component system response regulator AtoC